MTDLLQRYNEDESFASRVRLSNIPLLTSKTHTLDKFQVIKGARTAYLEVKNYVEGTPKHHFLSLFGEPGTGKTHLAMAVGWYWLENNQGLVGYYQAQELLDKLRSGFHIADLERQHQFDTQLNWIKEVPLLILDDLGAEKTTEWAEAILDSVIDHRYIREKKTVITTNETLEQLPPRVASRMQEGVVCVLQCGDYRKVKKAEREEPKK